MIVTNEIMAVKSHDKTLTIRHLDYIFSIFKRIQYNTGGNDTEVFGLWMWVFLMTDTRRTALLGDTVESAKPTNVDRRHFFAAQVLYVVLTFRGTHSAAQIVIREDW